MAISTQIKAIIRDNLPFTNDCVQSNAFFEDLHSIFMNTGFSARYEVTRGSLCLIYKDI